MADLPNFDRRMSDAEGLMWRLDKDPHLGSTFANITVLDRSPDLAVLRRRLERATYVVRRLRQRVQPGPVGLGAPVWVDDPDFDLDYHVRHIALPKPGTMRQLLDLGALITNDAFDRTRPLWQFVVIDGLRGGRSALLQKLHHTIVDGEGGVQLSLQFLDLERDAPEPPPLDPDLIAAASEAAHEPHHAETLRDVLAGSFRMPLSLAKQVKDLLADPTGIPAAGTAAADTVRGMLKEFEAIIAVVVGGVLLTGGYGTIYGAAFGALIFGLVQMGIFYTGIDTDWFKVFLGIVILVAVLVNNYTRAKALGERQGS